MANIVAFFHIKFELFIILFVIEYDCFEDGLWIMDNSNFDIWLFISLNVNLYRLTLIDGLNSL